MNEFQLELQRAIRTALTRLTLYQVGEVIAGELMETAGSLRDHFGDDRTATDYELAAQLLLREFAQVAATTNL